MKTDYTERHLFAAWLKKLLGIKSPSALFNSCGRYEFEYDFIMKTTHDERGEENGY